MSGHDDQLGLGFVQRFQHRELGEDGVAVLLQEELRDEAWAAFAGLDVALNRAVASGASRFVERFKKSSGPSPRKARA